MHPRQLEHYIAVVTRTLKDAFPDSFHQRCTYATFGLLSLLRDAGEDVAAIGGDFVAFILSKDGTNPSMKGFANTGGDCSHFWVETAERIIDPGTHFLPEDSSFPACAMPATAWNKSEALPNYLRYRERGRFEKGNEAIDVSIADKVAEFITQCRSAHAAASGLESFPGWIMTGRPSVRIAANRGDLWAIGASKFDGWVDTASIPF